MNAIRTFAEVKNHEVRLVLPKSVKTKKVEIIIIPIEREDDEPATGTDKLTDLQRLLLLAPDMNDDEFQLIQEKRKALNQWK
ncbi:MAG: hypothetical protein AAB316_14885 [Bacteroidota bacterium]